MSIWLSSCGCCWFFFQHFALPAAPSAASSMPEAWKSTAERKGKVHKWKITGAHVLTHAICVCMCVIATPWPTTTTAHIFPTPWTQTRLSFQVVLFNFEASEIRKKKMKGKRERDGCEKKTLWKFNALNVMRYVTHVAHRLLRPLLPHIYIFFFFCQTAALSAAILMYWKFAIFPSWLKNICETPRNGLGTRKGAFHLVVNVL